MAANKLKLVPDLYNIKGLECIQHSKEKGKEMRIKAYPMIV